jgi:beta-glucosidase/6-phospho-beta-glucosidase/beta-galactosidase
MPSTDTPRLELDAGFVVAAGIEASAPVIRGGVRQDELRKTGHWERYEEDLQLVASFGIRYLRYSVPFHVVARSDDPREFDWAWTDSALGALREAGLEPILDLLHFGLPDDLGAVGDRRLVGRYEVYATAVAERYPWVRYYTPVNEPLVCAWASTLSGFWNERRRTPEAFVAALDNLSTCAVRGMEIIRERRPDAIFIQSDACDSYRPLEPAAAEQAAFYTERGFVAYDLTYGRRPTPRIVDWLLRHGMSAQRLDWFEQRGSTEGCIVGHDYYRGNERFIAANGRFYKAGSRRLGFRQLALIFHERYGMPFMVAETNIGGAYAPRWLAEVWNDALQLRDEGLPIRGVCWYGFVDHVDWDSFLTRNRGRVNTCGLVGLDRRPHQVGEMYRDLATAALNGELRRIQLPQRRRLPEQPSATRNLGAA